MNSINILTDRGLKRHDLFTFVLLVLFGITSLYHPDTGLLHILGFNILRGYGMALFFLLSAIGILIISRFDWSKTFWLFRFLRSYYPQAFFTPLFFEAIILSAKVFGGLSHDQLFSNFDNLIFGFQPAREFSAHFGNSPWWNNIMFGAYFMFYFMLAITPWLPFFKKDFVTAERNIAVFSGYMLLFFSFYLFFRVQGPKYWLADLHSLWYSNFAGGGFVDLMRGVFASSTLSGAAFPSSHVGISLCMTILVMRTFPRLLPLYILLTALVYLSTVYIYAHWASDGLASFIIVPFVILLIDRSKEPVQKFLAFCNELLLAPILRKSYD